MNFGGFLDNDCGGGGGGGGGVSGNQGINYNESITGGGVISPHSRFISQAPVASKSIFTSPGLSLALKTGQGGGGGGEGVAAAGRMMESYEPPPTSNNNNNNNGKIRSRVSIEELEHDSRSGTDNSDGVSGGGDDLDGSDNKPPRKKKRYHRHTPQQIQELEALFKECPHPDEKQRLELSNRLCLETRQVKFWFQNRRTQMKTQLERHENSILRQENDKLRAENMSIREAMRNPSCTHCGGPAMMGEVSLEEQHLRMENARLKDELDRVCSIAGKFFGRPLPPHVLPNSSLELGVGGGGGNVVDFGNNPTGSSLAMVSPPPITRAASTMDMDRSLERSMYLELALTAMDELVKMAQTDEPIWVRNHHNHHQVVLNEEEYLRAFTLCTTGMKPNGFVKEASKETGMVIINSLALVETLIDANKWAEMFPCMIARSSTTDVISSGMGGTRNGALQLMHAELQVLSPLVPVREVNFLRFCKQHAEGVWAVVDVSIDSIRESSCGTTTTTTGTTSPSFLRSRRLPSGCLVQDMPNGYSKVTWVEHAEYDEAVIHQLYRPLVSAGMGFGAQRWIATLQRQCECLAILMSSTVSPRDHSAITASGKRSMLKLAQRMTDNFCAGVCASTAQKWNKLSNCSGNVEEDVRVMTRKSVDDPGEPPGVVVSAATSVWLPVTPQRLFDFLRDERLRSEWDILSNGGPMQEMAHIAKGQDHGNCVSLLRSSAMSSNQSSMLILQETSIDASGSLVVYAPVDIPAMHVVMNGGDSAYVALLPSGFAIVPDGSGYCESSANGPTSNGGTISHRVGGSLLTVAFQILVNSLPTAKLTIESVETVNNLISCTVQKIKAALQCD